ncbi:MAG: FAD-dependent thymidylate synthase, partial [Candidatus Thorarchaeota archaeon]
WLVSQGIPREDARYVLPQATPQNITVTMNARELLHFFYLRLSPAAQEEIRTLAQRMLKLVRQVAPVIFEDAGSFEC